MLAKYELPRGQWEELSTFIFQFCHSQDPQQREVCKNKTTTVAPPVEISAQVGVLLLSSVMETAALDVSLCLNCLGVDKQLVLLRSKSCNVVYTVAVSSFESVLSFSVCSSNSISRACFNCCRLLLKTRRARLSHSMHSSTLPPLPPSLILLLSM